MIATFSSQTARRTFAAALLLAGLAQTPAARADRGDLASEIVVQAMALLGVPYRWGGTDPARGLDCSGLVRHVFKNVGISELPRRAQEIRRIGARVAWSDLRAGDLVFFNTLGQPFSHVAIYVGQGRFVHAPSRNGQVRVDDIDDRYWRARFNGARRLAPAAEPTTSPRDLTVASNWRIEDFPDGP